MKASEVKANMDYKVIAEQTEVESNALKHVTQALEVVIAWPVIGDGVSRKLSSLRFAAEVFLRHLERLFAPEELDGYMEIVTQMNPAVTDQVGDLKREHEWFRKVVRKLVLQLERASPIGCEKIDTIGKDLRDVIQRIRDHGHREWDLLVECFNRDTGGEG